MNDESMRPPEVGEFIYAFPESSCLRITDPVGRPFYVSNVSSSAHMACPDLLRYEQIGEADNMRGRAVRAFFWLMRLWPT